MGQVIKVSTKAEVVVLDYHRDAFGIVRTAAKAAGTMSKRLQALLVSRYGQPTIGKDADGKETRSGGPSFDQYRADQSALAQLAKDAKLADNQFYRKSYASAVRTLYGALPESQDAAAIAKRAQRDAKKAAAPAPAPVGAPKGETTDRQPSESEQVESIIARIGVFKALSACIHILQADDSTKAVALHLQKMADKAAQDAAKRTAKEPATA